MYQLVIIINGPGGFRKGSVDENRTKLAVRWFLSQPGLRWNNSRDPEEMASPSDAAPAGFRSFGFSGSEQNHFAFDQIRLNVNERGVMQCITWYWLLGSQIVSNIHRKGISRKAKAIHMPSKQADLTLPSHY